jgi:hypothetical protein
MTEIIRTKIAGVSFTNEDGQSRQTLIKDFVKEDNTLYLKREPFNPYGAHTIAVNIGAMDTGSIEKKIGFLNSDLAAKLAPLMDSGYLITCRVLQVTGGNEEKTYGVNIELEIFTPQELADFKSTHPSNYNVQEAQYLPPLPTGPKTKSSYWKTHPIFLLFLAITILVLITDLCFFVYDEKTGSVYFIFVMVFAILAFFFRNK